MITVYEAAGGADGIQRLAEAWHRRATADEVVGHAFSHGVDPHHLLRLTAYWSEVLGGPAAYSARYGDDSAVVRMHSGNGSHEEMDRRAIACFDAALEDAGIADDPVRGVLHDYFAWATLELLTRYPDDAAAVPDGRPVPHWGWNGLVAD